MAFLSRLRTQMIARGLLLTVSLTLSLSVSVRPTHAITQIAKPVNQDVLHTLVQSRGNGNANAGGGNNGNGNANAGGGNNGNGSANANNASAGNNQSPTATSTVNETLVNQVQQIIEKEMDNGTRGAALSGIQQHNFHDSLSVFTMSSVSWMRHDGLTINHPNGKSRSAGFETVIYGATAGARLDASALFALKPETVTFGGFGNYTTSDFKTNGSDVETGLGKGALQSYALGGYSVINVKPFYLLGVLGQSWGDLGYVNESDQSKTSHGSDGRFASSRCRYSRCCGL